MLLFILVAYSFLGALIFYYLERYEAEDKESAWRQKIQENRTRLINELMPQIFNRSDLLIFIDPNQSGLIWETIEIAIKRYENDLGLKYTDRKIEWDFWNAMLYSGTIVIKLKTHFSPNAKSLPDSIPDRRR